MIPRPSAKTKSRRSGLTLAEVLVVIGILFVLVAMLLPTLGRARAASKQTACLSKLRQLGTAMTAYHADNDREYPRPAAKDDPQPEDWLYWQADRRLPAGSEASRLEGRLVRYLMSDKPKSGPPWSDKPLLEDATVVALRCPSDDLDAHPAYPFSYSINGSISRPSTATPSNQTLDLNAVKKPAQKILFICEASETLDDGCWVAQGRPTGVPNYLSTRHERRNLPPDDPNAGSGNVLFADGRAESVPRVQITEQRHWDPAWDKFEK